MANIIEMLEGLPTLSTGQAADLKLDTGKIRVWLSRCDLEDGETRPIQIERLAGGRWSDVDLSVSEAETMAYYYFRTGQKEGK